MEKMFQSNFCLIHYICNFIMQMTIVCTQMCSTIYEMCNERD